MGALVLASASPQRRAILEQLGIAFTVRPAGVEEETAGDPVGVARANARRKALAAARLGDGSETVLGVDTLVAAGGEIWGKPPDTAEARRTLHRLSGRTHRVVSGLALLRAGELQVVDDTTTVTFRELDGEAVERYLATGEWRERAGGYAIQGRGAALVRRIEGDYLNVVGLPAAALLDLAPELLGRRSGFVTPDR